MSREDIVAVASRLFALFLVATCIRNVADALSSSQSFGEVVAVLLVTSLPLLAIAALLWFFPLTIANRLLPVMKTPPPFVDPTSRSALELGLTLIGFWLLSRAMADLVYWAVLILQFKRASQPFDLSMEQVASFAATIADGVLGLWLMLGNRGLIEVLRRMRYGNARSRDADVP